MPPEPPPAPPSYMLVGPPDLLHDLSLDFLIAAAVRYQEYDLTAIQEIVDGLAPAPAARALAEEALGMSKGHLDSLRELGHAPVIPL